MNKYLLIAVAGTQSIGMLYAITIDYNQTGKALQSAHPLIQQEVSNIRNTIESITKKLESSGVTTDHINDVANTLSSLANASNSSDPDINQIRNLTEQTRSQLRTIIGKLDIAGHLDDTQRLFTNAQSLVAKLLDGYNVISKVLAILPANAVSALHNMQSTIEDLVSNLTTVVTTLQTDPNFQKIVQAPQQDATK